MEWTVGDIVTGKVSSIAKFGAFVALPGGKSGLVHISQVAGTFVSDIRDYLTEGQEVAVKVLAISPEGKINLSIRQAQPSAPAAQNGGRGPQRGAPSQRGAAGRSARPQRAASGQEAPAELTFEDRLKQFMALSDSKQSEFNRHIAGKRGGRRRK